MKLQRTAIGIYLALHITSSFAHIDQQNKTYEKDGAINTPHPVSLYALYAHREYQFNKEKLGNLNSFQGHSNLYVIGGNNFRLNDTLSAGIFIYKLTTDLNLSFTPSDSTNQSIRNQSVFAHLLNRFNANLYLDVLGGYGQNTMSYSTFAPQMPSLGKIGFGESKGNDWFTSTKAIYTRPWKALTLTGSAGVLYGSVTQNSFSYHYVSPLPSMQVPVLRTNSTILLESTEIAYSLTSNIKPFVTAGLIQVVNYHNNRDNNLPNTSSIGVLPDIASKHGGFELGGGLAIKYKQLALRVEQQYYERGSIYQSNQTLVSLTIALG